MIATRLAALSTALALAAALVPHPAAAARAIQISDYAKIVNLSQPKLSPDGKRIAFISSRVNLGENRNDRDLVLVDIATKQQRTLTYQRKELSSPAWSPSGDRIAFLAEDGDEKNPTAQIFVLPMDGGDARPATKAPDGVDAFAWRPDGKGFAYTAADAKPKKNGSAKYQDSFLVGNNPITAHEFPAPSHLWTIDADGTHAKQRTRGSEHADAPEYAADGSRIIFSLAPNATLNDSEDAHITVMDVATGAQRRLTGNAKYEHEPHFSPDGKHVAYLHSLGDDQITLSEVYVTDASGGSAGTPITRAYDRAMQDLAWTPDGSAVISRCNDGTHATLVRTPLAGASTRIDLGALQPTSSLEGALGADGGLAFIAATVNDPSEIYYRAANGAPERLTHSNEAIESLATATAETISFKTSLGMSSDAVLYKPAGYTGATKLPLVLYIHGGPTSASDESFDLMPHVMAARGWLVLQPNYRGSDNHGLAYQSAVRYDPEEGPGKDIMAAVDAVRARAIVDDHRMAVSGWSYGGIMTAWMTTHYHVWRAAVSGASVNNWTTDYSVADDSGADKAIFHGSPWVGNNRAEYDRASAAFYAKNVTNPVLILADTGDNRDPIATSYEFYHALKDNGKDVTFRAWPTAGHFPSDPVRRMDVFQHWVDFIAQHL